MVLGQEVVVVVVVFEDAGTPVAAAPEGDGEKHSEDACAHEHAQGDAFPLESCAPPVLLLLVIIIGGGGAGV